MATQDERGGVVHAFMYAIKTGLTSQCQLPHTAGRAASARSSAQFHTLEFGCIPDTGAQTPHNCGCG